MNRNYNEQHAFMLGQLISNLLSLELVARAVLKAVETNGNWRWFDGKEGEFIEESALTNYLSLGDILKKYNALDCLTEREKVDFKDIVDLRDALAHGRVWKPSEAEDDAPYFLTKFGKPKNGKVQITFHVPMSRAWFSTQGNLINKAMVAVHTAQNRLGSLSKLAAGENTKK